MLRVWGAHDSIFDTAHAEDCLRCSGPRPTTDGNLALLVPHCHYCTIAPHPCPTGLLARWPYTPHYLRFGLPSTDCQLELIGVGVVSRYFFGLLLWVTERTLCSLVQPLQLHAAWHCFAGFGTYTLNLYWLNTRWSFLQRKPVVAGFTVPSPYIRGTVPGMKAK